MMLSIPVTPETERRLRRMADAAGKEVADYVTQLVEQAAAKPSLDELLSPLRQQFAASGTTDERLVEEITAAQAAYRAALPKKTA